MKPISKTNDDAIIAVLRETAKEIDALLAERIAEVQGRINERWSQMPIETLEQAKDAEAQRLHDCGLDPDYIRKSVADDVRIIVALRNPPIMRPKNPPKIKTWYNAKTDIEWSYRDCGGHRDFDYRWAVGITNASRNNPIRAYQRNKALAGKKIKLLS